MSRVAAFLFVLVAYVVAGAVAIGTGIFLHNESPIIIVAAADFAATVVVFIFSVIARNSSVYDPYWSVAPVAIALFWLLQPSSDGLAKPRHVLIFTLVCLWAIRLTANWAYQWRGLRHEDWRYRDIKHQTGKLYWPVSFLGIHLMPTVLVFLSCLALWPTLSDENTQFVWLDVVAVVITLAAIIIEATADLQMRQFRRDPALKRSTFPPGLWSVSRHPNYFGEVLFWWGLFLFVPLLYPGFRPVVIGPLLVLGLFLSVSIPLMERHLGAEHPEYLEYKRQVPSPFVPWLAKRGTRI